MDENENKPMEEKETTGKIVEYKKLFPILVLLYIASITISVLTGAMIVHYDEAQVLTQELYHKTEPLVMWRCAEISVAAIVVSLIILIKAESLRAHNKAPKFYFTITALLLAIIGWFLFLMACIMIPVIFMS